MTYYYYKGTRIYNLDGLAAVKKKPNKYILFPTEKEAEEYVDDNDAENDFITLLSAMCVFVIPFISFTILEVIK